MCALLAMSSARSAGWNPWTHRRADVLARAVEGFAGGALLRRRGERRKLEAPTDEAQRTVKRVGAVPKRHHGNGGHEAQLNKVDGKS